MRVHRLTLRESVLRMGLPGLVGALLAGAAAVWAVLVLMPATEARERAEQQVLRAQAQAVAVERGEFQPEPPAARRVQDFHAALSAQPAATAAIDRLYAAADAEGISLARGEYALVVEQGGDMARYQVQLPLRARYAQLRRFLDAALASVPGLALEDLDLQRAAVSDSELDARVRLTLYLSRR